MLQNFFKKLPQNASYRDTEQTGNQHYHKRQKNQSKRSVVASKNDHSPLSCTCVRVCVSFVVCSCCFLVIKCQVKCRLLSFMPIAKFMPSKMPIAE